MQFDGRGKFYRGTFSLRVGSHAIRVGGNAERISGIGPVRIRLRVCVEQQGLCIIGSGALHAVLSSGLLANWGTRSAPAGKRAHGSSPCQPLDIFG